MDNFKPDISWMSEKYDEMNKWLFGGKLGACEFGIFTTGNGSGGNTLGCFKITGYKIKIFSPTHHMFRQGWNPDTGVRDEYVNRNNFVDLCRPRIEINGNYIGNEEIFLGILVHEMCHYYTYMEGFAPSSSHGYEFKEIASIVSYRSGGRFTVKRLASAEEMAGLELTGKMKERVERRNENKKNSLTAIFRFRNNGTVELTTTSDKDLIRRLCNSFSSSTPRVVSSNDYDLLTLLFDAGYKRNFRTWKYWNVENKDFTKNLDHYDISVYDYAHPTGIDVKGLSSYNDGAPSKNDVKEIKPVNNDKKVFILRMKTRDVDIDFGGDESVLMDKIREYIPKISDEVMKRLIANPANYKVIKESGRKKLDRIINEVVNNFIKNEVYNDDDNVIDITPNMNLGLYSPMEVEK